MTIAPAPENAKDLPALQADHTQVYVYRVYQADGTYVGRHFVLLKNKEGDDVVLQEPLNPLKDFKYQLQASPSVEQERGAIRLVRPGVSPSSPSHSYYLETIGQLKLIH